MQIRIYEEKYRDQIITLILSIQNCDSRVNLSLEDQPDLNNIRACYLESGGGFWVAVDENDKVIGTIGLMDKHAGCGVLKKFFVDQEYRGKEKGVSAKLFERLLAHAESRAMKRIVLDSPSVCLRAHGFYRKMGFERIAPEQLPVQYDYADRDSYLFLKELD